jgi:hypothetical protein
MILGRRGYRLNVKHKQLMDLKRKLKGLPAEGTGGKKESKSRQKQLQQLVIVAILCPS